MSTNLCFCFCVAASTSKPEATPQAERLCVTEHTAVTPPSHTQTGVMEPRPLQAAVAQTTYTQTPLTVPVCNAYHTPQLYDASSTSWLDAQHHRRWPPLLCSHSPPNQRALTNCYLPMMVFEQKPFTPITAQPGLPSSSLKDIH